MQFAPGVVRGVVPMVHMKSQEATENGTGAGAVGLTQDNAPVLSPPK